MIEQNRIPERDEVLFAFHQTCDNPTARQSIVTAIDPPNIGFMELLGGRIRDQRQVRTTVDSVIAHGVAEIARYLAAEARIEAIVG